MRSELIVNLSMKAIIEKNTLEIDQCEKAEVAKVFIEVAQTMLCSANPK